MVLLTLPSWWQHNHTSFRLARLRQKLASRAFCRHCSIAWIRIHVMRCTDSGPVFVPSFQTPWKLIFVSFFSTSLMSFCLESSWLCSSMSASISKVDSLNPQSFHQQGRAAPYDVRKDESRPWTSIRGTSPAAMRPYILPFWTDWNKRGAYMHIDMNKYIIYCIHRKLCINTTYHKQYQAMARRIKCMIRCDRATSYKQRDFLSKRLRQGRSHGVETPPQPLSNYQQEQSQTYHTNPTPPK